PRGGGLAEVRARFYGRSGLGGEVVAPSPALGPVEAARGLGAAGDIAADVAIAWVQGTGAGTRIVAAQLYQPPGPFGPRSRLHYTRSPRPVLSWSAPREAWPPLRYQVGVDGAGAAETTDVTSLPLPLSEGPHR